MSISTNITTKTVIKHNLKLNYQTRLWLDIIYMPAVELKEKIEKAMEDNPFLEYSTNDFNFSNKSSSLDIDSIIENTSQNSKESLFSHLKSQIEIIFNNKKDIELAEKICSFINNNGYLTISINDISSILNADIEKINKIISITF